MYGDEYDYDDNYEDLYNADIEEDYEIETEE
jgi:hypothetical protein